MPRHLVFNFLYSLFLVTVTAAMCSRFNLYAMENYYEYIHKPALTPPDYIFPIAWTIIYVMMIISFDFILNLAPPKLITFASMLFIGNLLLHILWSYIFFFNGYFLIGFAVLVVLDFLALGLVERFYRLHKIAGLMLLPYLAWLLFATYLNWQIVNLNGENYIF